MSKVLYGRRKGQAKSDPPQDIQAIQQRLAQSQQQSHGFQLPDGTDLRQVTVLSKGEWDRIQRSLNQRATEMEKFQKQQQEKEALRLKSKEMVKNWGNTIAGQRQRKLEARRLREEREEEEKKQIDIEEERYQAQKRKEAIEKAKTQQYYQTDRVKGFHGALMLTEVLKEREAQLELKRLKEQAYAGQDKEWLAHTQREHENAIKDDQTRALNRCHKTKQVANFQIAQMQDHQHQKKLEEHADAEEGESLKKLASHYLMEKEELENIRMAEKKQFMQDNMKQIADRKKMELINMTKEEEEDEESRVFTAAKRKMMKLRSEKEKSLHNEKQERLEKIREKLHAQMQQKVDGEDSRIKRATEEQSEKQLKEDMEAEKKRKKMFSEMAQHRHRHLKTKEEKASEERRRELDMLRIRQEADKVFQMNEQEKQLRKLHERKDLKGYHSTQMDLKAKDARTVKENSLAWDERNMELLKIEEDQFQEYAKKVIDHCERGQRNTYPLKKAAHSGAGGGHGPQFHGKGGIRPSYMACDQTGVQLPYYQRGTTEETKENIYGDGKTYKRLGFVW